MKKQTKPIKPKFTFIAESKELKKKYQQYCFDNEVTITKDLNNHIKKVTK